MKRLIVLILLLLSGCKEGDGEARTTSSASQNLGTREINMVIDVGEHRDIDLGLKPQGSYTVSSRVLASVGSYNQELSCNPNIAASEVKLDQATNVSVGVLDSRPTTLRIVGVYPGKEVVCTHTDGSQNIKINVTVRDSVPNPDLIAGSPIDPSNPGGNGGGNSGGTDPNFPPLPPSPNTPEGNAEKDPKACSTAGFYYIDDDYYDVEGHFGGDNALFLRSLMAGNVDSKIRIFYPIVERPAETNYVNLGQFSYEAVRKNTTVIFEVQMATQLFGVAGKEHFYVQSNGYCMRGKIPASHMTPPDKKLVWVTQ